MVEGSNPPRPTIFSKITSELPDYPNINSGINFMYPTSFSVPVFANCTNMRTNGYMMVSILIMIWRLQKLKRIEGLAWLIFILALSVASLATANEDTENPVEQMVHATEAGPFEFLTTVEGVYQTQVFLQSDGSLLLVWVQKGPYDLDLYAARQKPDGTFGHPLRINQRGLNRFTGDEARPGVSLGPHGAVAVAWTAANNDIMLAVGSRYGEQFDAPVKLNQDEGVAERTMPSVALSTDGVAHAVWLDPREAPKGREEPSDLYYASVKDGTVQELNLTVNQQPTVCGCCRPFISIDGDSNFNILFRNSDSNGYRDISRISGVSGSLGEPQRTSPPIWKLNACPSAGPISSAGGTLWKDASTGSWRMLWSIDPNVAPTELLTDQADLDLTYPPRTVSGREAWVLVGARPYGLIAEWKDGAFEVIRKGLPRWASSAVVKEGQLILVGNEKGQLYTETHTL